jgi:three-Cys-motif partner protein
LSNISTTTWPIEPHTKAKHEILRRYLGAWFPILSKWSGRIIYLDGFAGPGIYTGGDVGSPVVALETAVNHTLLPRFQEIKFLFIEKDKARAQKLKEVLKERFPKLPPNINYNVFDGEFAPTFEEGLNELEKQGANLAPTFAFIDPFGFSGLPMELIARLLSCNKCEVLITFMSGFVRRFHDELRENALNELYATDQWTKVRDIQKPEEKERFLLQLYENQLKNLGTASYVRSFGMIGQNNQTVYFLVYATKHLKGLEVMKDAMWKVDRSGTFKFSDTTGFNQSFIFDYENELSWVPNAAKAIFMKFRGKIVADEKIFEFVIAETPFMKRKAPLYQLEKESKIINVKRPEGSKRGFPEGSVITFAP